MKPIREVSVLEMPDTFCGIKDRYVEIVLARSLA